MPRKVSVKVHALLVLDKGENSKQCVALHKTHTCTPLEKL